MITGEMCKSGRAFLSWNRNELADAANLHFNVIVKLENGGNISAESSDKITATFAANGVTFTPKRDGFDMRARKPK